MADVLEGVQAAVADRYRIERELGTGGMATVYLAHDLKHDRPVALKVMRPELSAVLGGERFLREIRIAAQLNHPHILPLHDSGDAGGLLYYVMPFVEGESLRAKLEREKQLSVDEAIALTTQVAAALDYAHEQGVIHRDIKPENILIQRGEALVADFGIALAVTAAGGNRLTDTGLSLGTPEYMSPEQATGDRQLDARSDVYSLGAVTYEMLVGEPPHPGSTVQAIIARVLSAEPQPVSSVRRSVPVNIDAAVMCALAKTPADRFASGADFVAALNDPTFTVPSLARVATSPTARRHTWLALAWASLMTLVAALAVWFAAQNGRPNKPSTVKLSAVLPQDKAPRNGSAPLLAISPDGSLVAYVAPRAAQPGRQLYVRPIDQFRARAIAGTEGARGPFFSPDGEWVGFYQGSGLKKVRLADGLTQTIADSVPGSTRPPTHDGASWGPDGRIILGVVGSGLYAVPASGGVPEAVTALDYETGEHGHTLPHVLPGGELALFTIRTGLDFDRTSVGIVSFETGERNLVVEGGFHARYVPPGFLVYADNTSLFAMQFDTERRQAHGEPVLVVEDVRVHRRRAAHFGISAGGALAYLPAQSRRANDSLFWVDRSGTETPILSFDGTFNVPRLSPDGRHVAISSWTGVMGMWMLDVDRGVLSPLAGRSHNTHLPVWTPDGTRLVFTSDRDGPQDLFWQAADGSGEAEPLYSSPPHKDAASWSPDGTTLAFAHLSPQTGFDIWVLDVTDAVEARPFLETPFWELNPMISPDGNWLAYTSDVSGQAEVYLTPFPEGGQKVQVSTSGGREPLWRRDGRELFYRDGDQLMAVTVEARQGLSVEQPRLLFRGPYAGWAGLGPPNYDIAPDGQRFLMLKHGAPIPEVPQINIVLNWVEELKERVGR